MYNNDKSRLGSISSWSKTEKAQTATSSPVGQKCYYHLQVWLFAEEFSLISSTGALEKVPILFSLKAHKNRCHSRDTVSFCFNFFRVCHCLHQWMLALRAPFKRKPCGRKDSLSHRKLNTSTPRSRGHSTVGAATGKWKIDDHLCQLWIQKRNHCAIWDSRKKKPGDFRRVQNFRPTTPRQLHTRTKSWWRASHWQTPPEYYQAVDFFNTKKIVLSLRFLFTLRENSVSTYRTTNLEHEDSHYHVHMYPKTGIP